MSANPSDDIVRLATAPNPAQAHLWEQALRQAGVRCKVVGDYLDAGIGDIPGLRAELWVHKDDVARGEEVLREMQNAGAGRDEEE
jgi:hypothetical protein